MNNQGIVVSGLDVVLRNLSATSFFYLTIEGLLNPDNSLSQANFSFTFINASTSFASAVLRF